MSNNNLTPQIAKKPAIYARLLSLGRQTLRIFYSWFNIIFLTAQIVILAFSISSYDKYSRKEVLKQIYLASGKGFAGYILVITFFNLALIHLLATTIISYGLNEYATDAVVRLLFLEIIPLITALYISLKYTISGGTQIYAMRSCDEWRELTKQGIDPLGCVVLPKVLAAMQAMLLWTLTGGLISLILTYLIIHGFNMSGIFLYNNTLSQIFTPLIAINFFIKVIFLALIIGILPVANAISYRPSGKEEEYKIGMELQTLIHMFVLIVLVEMLSLMGNYY